MLSRQSGYSIRCLFSALLLLASTADHSPGDLETLPSNSFAEQFVGTDIFDGVSTVGDWTQVDDAGLSLNGSNLVMQNVGANAWIQQDGGATAWGNAVTNSWTFEIRFKVLNDAAPESATSFWLDGGGQRQIMLAGESSISQFTGGTIYNNEDNTDKFHTIRIAFDHESGLYHLWRDAAGGFNGTVISTSEGAESGTRLIIGDCCSSLGDASSDIEIEYVRFDGSNAYSPNPIKGIHVYILTGQSNSLGTTNLEGPMFDPGDESTDAATDFFWSNVSASNSGYPASLYGDSGSMILALQMQQGDGGENPAFWGPEFGFSRTLFQNSEGPLLFIKASRGGGSNSLWDKDVFDGNHNAGHMWGHLRDSVDAALAMIPTGSFEVKGFLYQQGESNTTTDANLADVRMLDLIDNLKTHINASHPGTADKMQTVIAEIAASQSNANRITTTALQQAVAAANDDIFFVGTRDLPLKSDGIHFGRDAKLEIGTRMAGPILGQPVVVTTFASIVAAANSEEIVFDLYVPDDDGAPNGPNLIETGTYEGFADGDGGQPDRGVVFDGSAGIVVFADYYGGDTTSDIAGGDFDFAGAGFPLEWDDSGQSITITFVDSTDTMQAATVAGVGFELAAVEGDNVTAAFLDSAGNLLYETFALSSGTFGFESINPDDGSTVSLIHQVVVAGDGGVLWTMGHVGDTTTTDFACHGHLVGILGDVNCDGVVNLLDVGPFVDVLTSGNFNPKADINQDGVVNLLDVDPFVAILTGD